VRRPPTRRCEGRLRVKRGVLWKWGNLITVRRGRGACPVSAANYVAGIIRRVLPCRIVMSIVFNVSDDFGRLLLEGWVCEQSRLFSFESFS
jgi:hypothetical protein